MKDETATEYIKQITLGDLRNTAVPELIGQAVEPHSVVIFSSPDGAGGSGTLISYRGIKGILTCSHVVRELQGSGKVLLPCLLRKDSDDIWDLAEVPFVRILTIDNLDTYSQDGWSENGLDIALIQFEDHVFEGLITAWNKQEIDLQAMRKKYCDQDDKYWSPENKHHWTWVISGAPREGCYQSLTDKVQYLPFAAAYIGGGETKLRLDTLQNTISKYVGIEADIIETQIGLTDDSLPMDFSGMSGGGTYQVAVQVDDGYKIDEMLLAGVFAAGNKASGTLFSRGHISLYDVFCSFLDEQLGGPDLGPS